MRFLVTGCAGFIGSHLADRLLSDGHEVVGYDNFSTGQARFIAEAEKSPRFRLVRADVLDQVALAEAMAGADLVFHLAANADVRFGTQHPTRNPDQKTMTTSDVPEASRINPICIFIGPFSRPHVSLSLHKHHTVRSVSCPLISRTNDLCGPWYHESAN